MVTLSAVKQEASELTEEEQDNLAAFLTALRLARTTEHADSLTEKLHSNKSTWIPIEDIDK